MTKSGPREYPDRPARFCRFCNGDVLAYRAEFRRHIRGHQDVYWNNWRAKFGRFLYRPAWLRSASKDYKKAAA
jgi:hypothetical protein